MMSDNVKVFGCRPHESGAADPGAGVRKPPREETAGCRARWRVTRYGDFVAGRFVSEVRWRRFAVATEKVDGIDRAITMGRAGNDERLVDKPMAEVVAAASDLVAGREPATLTRRFVM